MVGCVVSVSTFRCIFCMLGVCVGRDVTKGQKGWKKRSLCVEELAGDAMKQVAVRP